jgi:N6-adenine-specific methylase
MKKILTILLFAALCTVLPAQTPDPNFFIYLCFGQSNMEAGARPAEQDKDFNDPRFQFMAAVDMPRFQRERGHWYTAVPPICRETNNMGPVDFFGRKMIEVLPEPYRVGVINVSVAGAKLELWDKDACEEYLAMEAADPSRSWLINMAKEYGMNPYRRLMETAREAQKYGVIKGMLLHQGESNPDDPAWPGRVKKIHDDLCADLGLNPDEIPLLAGELKYAEQDGVCAAFNDVVLPHLPEVMPNAYVISALGCESTGDQFHFSTEGFRFLERCRDQFDFIFADPPYMLKELEQLPDIVLSRDLLRPEGLFVLEHGKTQDFSAHPRFVEHRAYGSVNFSFFQ